MSAELDNRKRLESAEKEVSFLKEELARLVEAIAKTKKDLEESPAFTENQKLRYRLNILKRAAMDVSTTPVGDKELYSILPVVGQLVTNAIRKAYPDVPIIIPVVTTPTLKFDTGADYQCTSALNIFQNLKAKGIKTKPSEIAEKIVANLETHPIFGSCQIAPAGYINIRLNRTEGVKQIQKILDHGVLPPKLFDKKMKIVVDFSSPNIAKEMHVGHLRSTIIGESTCRLLEYLKQDVLRINHVGDWGTQFGMLIAHLQDEFPDYRQSSPSVTDLMAFYRASKKRFDEDADFKQRAYSCVVKLQNGEPDYIKAWQLICDASRKEFQKVYDRLGVTLIERGESFYQQRMVDLVRELEEKNLLTVEDGRKIMWAEGISVPFTVVKSDGGFTYDTSDLATIRQRIEEEKGDWLIYITDAGQSQHFDILRRCAVQLGYMDPAKVRMDHVSFGVVLGEDRKKFKTRSGDTVRLVDLLDEGLKRASEKLIDRGRREALTPEEFQAAQKSIAYGCIKYADLSHNRCLDYVFSFDKMLEDKGNTAVYLLYAFTRIQSVFRTAGVTKEQLKEASKTTSVTVEHEKEWKLVNVLLRFPEVLTTICSTLLLHTLCDFVYDIAIAFTEFYDTCYCLEKNEKGEIVKVNMGRLLLTEATARMMETCFHILGLEPVGRM